MRVRVSELPPEVFPVIAAQIRESLQASPVGDGGLSDEEIIRISIAGAAFNDALSRARYALQGIGSAP